MQYISTNGLMADDSAIDKIHWFTIKLLMAVLPILNYN